MTLKDLNRRLGFWIRMDVAHGAGPGFPELRQYTWKCSCQAMRYDGEKDVGLISCARHEGLVQEEVGDGLPDEVRRAAIECLEKQLD